MQAKKLKWKSHEGLFKLQKSTRRKQQQQHSVHQRWRGKFILLMLFTNGDASCLWSSSLVSTPVVLGHDFILLWSQNTNIHSFQSYFCLCQLVSFCPVVRIRIGAYLLTLPIILCVQEVVTHFNCKLQYKLGHYFLDMQ